MPQDRHGTDIHKGDTVHFVHFGDEHTATVEDVGDQLHSPHLGNVPFVEVQVTTYVPAAAVQIVETAKKPEKAEAKPEPKAETTPEHRTEPSVRAQEKKGSK